MWNEPEVQEVLLLLPSDGQWLPGRCAHKEIIMALLDEDSPLIEENEQPVDGVSGAEWQVRLTAFGMAVASAICKSKVVNGTS